MAMLCLSIPEKTSIELNKIDVPGDKIPMREYHITLFYLAHLNPNDVSKLIKIVSEHLQFQKTFELKLDNATAFGKSNEVPIVSLIESYSLQKLRGELAKRLDEADIDYSKKYPKYNPHLTLSYADNKYKDFFLKFKKPLYFNVNHICYYSGDHMDGFMFRIPFKK